MSSSAAAAISAMITSQVYPQLYYPAPARPATRQRSEDREPELEPEALGAFAKGTSRAIGGFQIFIGIGILITLLVTFLASNLTLLNIVISVASSIVFMTNGAMSCSRWRCRARVKRRRVLIKVTIMMNTLGVLMAVTSIVLYCLAFNICYRSYCTHDPKIAMVILTFLSILELAFAIMTVHFVWDHLKDTDDLDLVAFSREGWRDGERGDGNEKPLRVTSPSATL